MNKKQRNKKLVLARQTVRNLKNDQLAGIIGGLPPRDTIPQTWTVGDGACCCDSVNICGSVQVC